MLVGDDGAVLCCGALGCVVGCGNSFHSVGVRGVVAALFIGVVPVAPVAALFLEVCDMLWVGDAVIAMPLICVASGLVALYLVPASSVIKVGMPIAFDIAWNSAAVVSVVVTLMKWE